MRKSKKTAGMNRNDMEKGTSFDKDQAPSPDYRSSIGGEPSYEETTIIRQNLGKRIFDSFQRDPSLSVSPRVLGGRVYDSENAAINTAISPLARRLKSRHLQMIAIGGSIGMLACFRGSMCGADEI